jgi:hypothetical protein
MDALTQALANARTAAQALPPPVEAPPVATTWQPGDPLTNAQPYLLGKPLWVVAMAADNPPTADVARTWPGAEQPYTQAIHDAIAAARTLHTPVGVPEAGTINPPVGQGGTTKAAATPEERAAHHAEETGGVPPPVQAPAPGPVAAALEGEPDTAALRQATKDQCILLGVLDPATGKPIDKSSRLGLKALHAAMDAYLAAKLRAEAQAPAPAALPEGFKYAGPADAARPQDRHGLVPVDAPPPVQAPAPAAEAPPPVITDAEPHAAAQREARKYAPVAAALEFLAAALRAL